MYSVWFLTDDGGKGFIAEKGRAVPMLFDQEETAWEYVEEYMNSENHPRLMWVRRHNDS